MPSLQLIAVLGSALSVVWPRGSRASLVPSRPASGEWMSVNIAPSSGTERSIREVRRNFVAADVSLVVLGVDHDGINDFARAVGWATCESNMQSYEVASDVSTDTGDR